MASVVAAVKPYKIYLRGELAKLRIDGDVADLLAKGSCDLARFGIPSLPQDIQNFFATQDRVDRFVESLTDAQAIELTACCERWRRNGIAATLASLRRAEMVSAPVDRVLLREAESWILPILHRHGYWLPAVAGDPELLSREPYRSRPARSSVDFPICIAKLEGGGSGMYRLVDGVHRAIQLFRGGESHLSLCLVTT